MKVFNGQINTQFIKPALSQVKSNFRGLNYDEVQISEDIKKLKKYIPERKINNIFDSNPKIKKDIKRKIKQMKKKEPDKSKIILDILPNIYIITKTNEGVSDVYASRFINELMNMDIHLLQNVVDNKISIEIYDDIACYEKEVKKAQYIHSKRILRFAERNDGLPIVRENGKVHDTVKSLGHELGHALDYNNGKKLNLTKQDSVTKIYNLKFDSYIDMPSFSKEFDEAFTADYINMFEIDKAKGKEDGTTFRELLQNDDFKYSLGGGLNKDGDISFYDIKARKELFAQMVSYVTTGELTHKEFQERIEELFPNLLKFTKEILAQN